MSHEVGEGLLWLLVIWVGIQLGGGLYEKRVVVPQWSSAPPSEIGAAITRSGQEASALRFWAFVSPPVVLLALANGVAAWQSHAGHRPWWLAASALVALYTAFTYAYFVPTMLRLWKAEQLAPAKVQTMVFWWTHLNYLRLAMGIGAWLTALKALAPLGPGPGG